MWWRVPKVCAYSMLTHVMRRCSAVCTCGCDDRGSATSALHAQPSWLSLIRPLVIQGAYALIHGTLQERIAAFNGAYITYERAVEVIFWYCVCCSIVCDPTVVLTMLPI